MRLHTFVFLSRLPLTITPAMFIIFKITHRITKTRMYGVGSAKIEIGFTFTTCPPILLNSMRLNHFGITYEFQLRTIDTSQLRTSFGVPWFASFAACKEGRSKSKDMLTLFCNHHVLLFMRGCIASAFVEALRQRRHN